MRMRDTPLRVTYRCWNERRAPVLSADRAFAYEQKVPDRLNSDILTNPAGLMLDLVHPGDDGMQEMGRNLAARVRAEMGV